MSQEKHFSAASPLQTSSLQSTGDSELDNNHTDKLDMHEDDEIFPYEALVMTGQ